MRWKRDALFKLVSQRAQQRLPLSVGMLFRKEFQPFRKRQPGMNERGQLMNNFSALLFFPQCGINAYALDAKRHNALMLQGDDQRQTIVHPYNVLFQLTFIVNALPAPELFNAHGAFPERAVSLQRTSCLAQRRDSHFQKASLYRSVGGGLPVLAPMRRSQLTDVMPG